MKQHCINLLIVIVFCSFSPHLHSQDSLRIGDYFDYLSYQVFKKHVETPDHYYSTADVGLVQWDKSDMTYDLLSKVDGLSDIEPQHLAYDATTDAVIIAYANSNIDILYADKTLNVRDILTNKKISGRRTINKLITDNGNLYIVGDYGLSIYNLSREEFVLTLFTEKITRGFNFSQDYFYLSTAENYYVYDRSRDISFLVSLEEWDKLGGEQNLPAGIVPGKIGVSESCVVFQDKNKFLISDHNNLNFTPFHSVPPNTVIPFIKREGNEIQIGVRNTNFQDYVLTVGNNCTVTDTIRSPCINYLYGYMETSNGDILIGDGFLGFHYIDSEGACNVLQLPGPEGIQAYDITYQNDTLYATAGGVNKIGYQGQNQHRGFSIFDGERWHRYSDLSYPQLRQYGFVDIVQAIPAPNSDKIYLNSAKDGLAVFEDGNFTFYDENNSCLEEVGASDHTIRIPAMTLDEKGNLWMSNFFADYGLKVFRDDGSCEQIDIPVGEQLGQMIFDERGNLWASIIGNDGAILVYNPERKEFRVISSSNSVLDADVRSLALDKNGAVWVGATNGAYVFYDAFNGRGVRPAVDINEDNVGDYLLMDQFVTAIDIDAANRKWFGTNNGVIVQSANGLESELRLTTDNSPLPSDEILDFAFDDNRGIAYIGTKKGILGVKIKATGGNAVHKKNIYAYPNPVRPSYEGPIAIKGLAEGANVKIVDAEGYLVKQLEAYGGQAIWDGTNRQGQVVSSGVYLVFSAAYGTQRKPDAATTKILVIK